LWAELADVSALVGKKPELLLLDPVLHLPASAVEVFVEELPGPLFLRE
jgi:hypothetical protein